MARPKKQSIEDFIATPRPAGRACVTCLDPARARIEAQCARYNAARKAGETDTPWVVFFRAFLRPQFGPRAKDHRSLLRHLSVCLGWEIH